MIPDATKRINHLWFYREALMTLMAANNYSTLEVAARLGTNADTIRRHLIVKGSLTRARSMRYPEQYLISLMIGQSAAERLLKSHYWRGK